MFISTPNLLMHRSALCAVIAVSSVALSACMNMSGLGGTSDFQCKAPEGIPCQSVSGVYANDMAGNLPSMRPHDSSASSNPRGGGPAPDQVAMAHAPGLVGSDRAVPVLGAIRSEPTVIRIWMAPWEDADGDLNEESRVYLQIDNGRWLIEHNRDRIRQQFAPMTPVALTAPAAQQASISAAQPAVPGGAAAAMRMIPGAARAGAGTPLPSQPARTPLVAPQPAPGAPQ